MAPGAERSRRDKKLGNLIDLCHDFFPSILQFPQREYITHWKIREPTNTISKPKEIVYHVVQSDRKPVTFKLFPVRLPATFLSKHELDDQRVMQCEYFTIDMSLVNKPSEFLNQNI